MEKEKICGIYKIKKEHIKNKEYIGWNFLKNLFYTHNIN